MSSVSKITVDRERIIQNVIHAVDHHLVPSAEQVIAAMFDGQVPAQITAVELCTALSDTLRKKMESVREADIALALDEYETKEARVMRDDAFGTKSNRMRALRNGLLASYGQETLDAYGLKEVVPDVPHRLVPYALNVADRLEKRPITQAPQALMPTFDSVSIAADIRAMTSLLQQRIDQVGRETREDQLSRARRDVIRENSWRTYQSLVTIVEGMFRLIERDDLASRVRLTSRRRAGKPEPEDLTFDNADEPSATTDEQPAAEPT